MFDFSRLTIGKSLPFVWRLNPFHELANLSLYSRRSFTLVSSIFRNSNVFTLQVWDLWLGIIYIVFRILCKPRFCAQTPLFLLLAFCRSRWARSTRCGLITVVLLSLSHALRILVHIVRVHLLIHLLGRERRRLLSCNCWEIHIVDCYVLHSDVLVHYAVTLVCGRLLKLCFLLLRIVVRRSWLVMMQGVCIAQLLGNWSSKLELLWLYALLLGFFLFFSSGVIPWHALSLVKSGSCYWISFACSKSVSTQKWPCSKVNWFVYLRPPMLSQLNKFLRRWGHSWVSVSMVDQLRLSTTMVSSITTQVASALEIIWVFGHWRNTNLVHVDNQVENSHPLVYFGFCSGG